jgi:ketosteroid isomerase-like protein
MDRAADRAAPVLAANREFYRAFRSRDTGAMARLWAEQADLVCIHPGWAALTDRAEILESWRGILESRDAPPIACRDETVRFLDATAVVVCVESIGGSTLTATNIFVREGEAWRLALHQASPTARSLAAAKPEPSKTLH